MKKYFQILVFLTGLLFLVSCEKMTPDRLQGSWQPVYASGSYEDYVYIYSYDGFVDEHGYIPMTRVGKNYPYKKYESTMLITGFRFFKEDGKDLFTTFEMDSPNNELGIPLQYKIDDDMLYLEQPLGAIINGLGEGSGEFDEGTPISLLGDGQIIIGNITYNKM